MGPSVESRGSCGGGGGGEAESGDVDTKPVCSAVVGERGGCTLVEGGGAPPAARGNLPPASTAARRASQRAATDSRTPRRAAPA
jgi:hypothetical protein